MICRRAVKKDPCRSKRSGCLVGVVRALNVVRGRAVLHRGVLPCGVPSGQSAVRHGIVLRTRRKQYWCDLNRKGNADEEILR